MRYFTTFFFFRKLRTVVSVVDDKMSMAHGGMILAEENGKYWGGDPVCMSLCPPYIRHGIVWKYVGRQTAVGRHLWKGDFKYYIREMEDVL